MSADDNPFAPKGGSVGYGAAQVAYGEQRVNAPTNMPANAPSGVQTAGAGTASIGPLIKDTTTAEFQADVVEASKSGPVLIDFWAPWCGPCKQLTPILEAAVQRAGGSVRLVKMNIDEHPAIAGQMGVQSIPAVIAFADGKPVDGFMGAKSESEVAEFIQKLSAASGADDNAAMAEQAFQQADEAIKAGDINRAAGIYQAVLQHMPDNADAYAALAGLMADYGSAEQAQAMLDNAVPEIANHPGILGVKAKLELAKKVADMGDPAELAARLAQNAKDHDAAFDLALIYNAQGKREEAADLLLGIIGADRKWRDDGARNELLTLFEAWGPMDEATQAARRKLASILFR